MKDKINFEEYTKLEKKLEIKYGTIKFADRINNKMLKLTVDFDEENLRTVVTNIGKKVENVEILIGYQFPFVTNLEPAMISGFMSEAMIMVVEDEEENIQWPSKSFKEGSKLL